MTSPLLSSQCCTSAGFVPWEFCNGLAWDTPGIQSSCEGFPCKLQTQIYCREGNLRAPANEARWNRPFPGNSEETVWGQLAHCPAACWKCKVWAVVKLSGEKNRDTGGMESLQTLRKRCVMVTSRVKMKKKSLPTSSIYIQQYLMGQPKHRIYEFSHKLMKNQLWDGPTSSSESICVELNGLELTFKAHLSK